MQIQIFERGQFVVEAGILKHDAEALADFVLLVAGSRPSISILPLVGRSSVVSILMVVVLPAPLGPRKAKISPMPTSKVTSRTAWISPKVFVRCSTRIILKY